MNVKEINNIPIEKYIGFLGDRRLLNKDMVIEYTNKIYNIDLSVEINKHVHLLIYPNTDVYLKFENTKPRKKPIENTRAYFNSCGRKYFLDFINKYSEDLGYDAFILHRRSSAVHHIYPMVFGGSNELTNLLQTCDLSHDLLHLNPKENDEIECFRSLDYLAYLYSFENIVQMFNKNNIAINDTNPKLMYQLFKTLITDEMGTYFAKLSA